jgi:hypothetical protein
LRVGDKFIGPSGELAVLVDSQRADYPDGITVYNFSVEDDHNYFVIANYEAFQNGAQPVLVHNAKYSYTSDQIALQNIVKETTNNGHKILSVSDAEIILEWAKQINYPNVRASFNDVTGKHGLGCHIHIPGVGSHSIFVSPGVRPR